MISSLRINYLGVNKMGASNYKGSSWAQPLILGLFAKSTSSTSQHIEVSAVGMSFDGIRYEYSLTGNSNWQFAGNSALEYYNASGLSPNVRYYWRAAGYKGSKIGSYSNIDSDTTFCTEYSLVYAAKSYLPDKEFAANENVRLKELVDSGFYAEMDVIRLWSSHSAADSLINWRNPSNNLAENTSNAADFSAYTGYTGASTGSKRIDHKYNPRTQGVKFVINSASMGFYSFTDVSNDVYADMGARDSGPANSSYIIGRQAAGTILARMNQDTTSGQVLAVGNSIGLISTTRNVAGIAVHKDKVHSVVQARTLTNVPNQNIWSLCYNNAGAIAGQSTRTQGFSFIGGFISNEILDSTSDTVSSWMSYNSAFSEISDWKSTGLSKGGVMLQFYDYFVDGWVDADAVLSQYGWKATFFTSAWNVLGLATKNKIKQLDQAGHEIASHTYDNVDYYDFIAGGGTDQQYVDDHIKTDIVAKEAFGIRPLRTFGPVGYNIPLSVTDKIFSETTIKNSPYIDLALYDNPENFRSRFGLMYKRASGGVLYKSAGILDQNVVGYDMNNIMATLQWAKDNNEIIIMEGHEIVVAPTGSNQTKLSDLETICSFIYSNGMGFYTPNDVNPMVTTKSIPLKPYSGVIGFGGTLQVGQTLSFSVREEDDRGNAVLIKEYQWQKADDSTGTNKTTLVNPLPNKANYTITSGELGKYIRCGCRLTTGSNIGYWSYTQWRGAVVA